MCATCSKWVSAIYSKSLLSLSFYQSDRIKKRNDTGRVYAGFWQHNVQKQTPFSGEGEMSRGGNVRLSVIHSGVQLSMKPFLADRTCLHPLCSLDLRSTLLPRAVFIGDPPPRITAWRRPQPEFCRRQLSIDIWSFMPLAATLSFLLVISFSSPTLSFITDLKPFSANRSHCSFSFSSSGLTAWFPRLLRLLLA